MEPAYIHAHLSPDRGIRAHVRPVCPLTYSNIMRNVNSSGCDWAAHLLMHFHPCIYRTRRENSVNNILYVVIFYLKTTTNTRNRLRNYAQMLIRLTRANAQHSLTTINLPSFFLLSFVVFQCLPDWGGMHWTLICCSNLISMIFSFICFFHSPTLGDWGNRRFTAKI